MPFLQRDGEVFVLYLGTEGQTDSENRFHPDWMTEFHKLVDETEASEGHAALVLTATGKFFSNGLDTDWLFGNFDKLHGYLDTVHQVFARVLTSPLPTVAAINGHAFGAGAMLATSCDSAVMRADRGFFCLPEVVLNMPFTVGMNALMTTRLTNRVAVQAMTTGRRFGGDDAVAAGIVDEAAAADQLLPRAVARAAELARLRGANLATIKKDAHASVLTALAVATTPANLAFG